MEPPLQLAICELFSPHIHGITVNSSKDIEEHWLVHTTITAEEFYDDTYTEDIAYIQHQYGVLNQQNRRHPLIRNYTHIVSCESYIKLNIVHIHELEGGNEIVGYIKTHWLKVIQRAWKRFYAERKRILEMRSSNKALMERQLTGKWPLKMRAYRKFIIKV